VKTAQTDKTRSRDPIDTVSVSLSSSEKSLSDNCMAEELLFVVSGKGGKT